ncbi:MAG: TIGR02391 family protein [Rhodospirillaceae bacterium]|nr:TIGR02391 family protein [Rhodospirillaceae bacterium]
MANVFSSSQLQAIADALADTNEGLTGSEIAHLLAQCKIPDPSSSMTKRHRLYNAFVASHNETQDRSPVLAFIRKAMKPEKYAREMHRYEPMRANLNRALVFVGLCVEEDGSLVRVDQARTLSDAQRRAQELRADLDLRGVHSDVLAFCREELLADNYFHAVFEAVKSVAQKLRNRTGLTDDGTTLVDRSLGGDPPMLAINSLKTESERSEQKGFANIVRGTFGMFRNTLAHAPKVTWEVSKRDAEDILSLVSMIHRRLDAATMPSRV